MTNSLKPSITSDENDAIVDTQIQKNQEIKKLTQDKQRSLNQNINRCMNELYQYIKDVKRNQSQMLEDKEAYEKVKDGLRCLSDPKSELKRRIDDLLKELEDLMKQEM